MQLNTRQSIENLDGLLHRRKHLLIVSLIGLLSFAPTVTLQYYPNYRRWITENLVTWLLNQSGIHLVLKPGNFNDSECHTTASLLRLLPYDGRRLITCYMTFESVKINATEAPVKLWKMSPTILLESLPTCHALRKLFGDWTETSLSFNLSIEMKSASPCAWLERGGIFNMPQYYNIPGPFVQRRQACLGLTKCPLTWLPPQDTQALTFKLIGIDDMRDYEFQAHFCTPVYGNYHRYCTNEEGEIAYELRQTGTWLTLDRVNCRCLGVADVERYGYSKGVLPDDKVFRGNYIQMTCAKRPKCTLDEYCYVETPSSDGYIYGGRVPCICPKEHYCPIYFIRDKRIPQTNDHGRVVSYGLRCKRRMY